MADEGARLWPVPCTPSKLVLIGAVPPLLVKTPRSPDGIPKEVFDNLRGAYAANRAAFY
ncbi:MAG: hypothetical protein JNL21_39025 [Myxococcales bacterium]|nr:hypothetical protein [Myxococcales bacterium]